jgi:hypothetical protein
MIVPHEVHQRPLRCSSGLAKGKSFSGYAGLVIGLLFLHDRPSDDQIVRAGGGYVLGAIFYLLSYKS